MWAQGRGKGGRGRAGPGAAVRVPINYFLCPDLRSPPSLNVVINQVFSRGRDKSPTGPGGRGGAERDEAEIWPVIYMPTASDAPPQVARTGLLSPQIERSLLDKHSDRRRLPGLQALGN